LGELSGFLISDAANGPLEQQGRNLKRSHVQAIRQFLEAPQRFW
jgi:hypothetical protein